MKVFLVILTMFATLGSNPIYAADEPGGRSAKTQGIFSAFAEFLASVFGGTSGDGTSGTDSSSPAGTDSNSPAGTDSSSPNGNSAPITDSGGSVGTGDNGSSSPMIQDNNSSAEFIAAQIAAETGWSKEKMIPYSTRLAKTLSQLSAKEQAIVFYGSGS